MSLLGLVYPPEVVLVVSTVPQINSTHVNSTIEYILVGVRYLYKRSLGSVDGVWRVPSADGAVWELQDCEAIYASDFCTDTPSIMQAYRVAANYGCEFVVDTNLTQLDAVTDDPVNPGNNAFKSVLCGISNTVVRFVGQGAFRLRNQNRPQSHIIYLANNVTNITLINPVLEGDRLTNNTIGEHGWGLTILQSSNITVLGGTYTNMFGDGIYIGMKWGTTDGTVPSNILLDRPVVSGCRRNGISLTSGDNVRIVKPQIYKVGDSDGVLGAAPKAGIDIEPEADEDTVGFTVPRLVACTIVDPYIHTANTGLELNLFPQGLVVDVHVQGTCTLTDISNRGVTATRVRSGGVGTVRIDRVLYKTTPIDVCVLELLGNDAITVHIGALVDEAPIGGSRNIRLLPRTSDPVSVGLSSVFKGIRIARCIGETPFILLAGTNLSQYHLDIDVGAVEDSIVPSLQYDVPGSGPASVRGFLGGTSLLSEYQETKLLCSTIVVNTATQDTDVQLNATNDFRTLCITRYLTSSSNNRFVILSGIKLYDGVSDVFNMRSNTFGCSVQVRNIPGVYTQVASTYGAWATF